MLQPFTTSSVRVPNDIVFVYPAMVNDLHVALEFKGQFLVELESKYTSLVATGTLAPPGPPL